MDRGQATRSCGPGMDQGWGGSWSSRAGARAKCPPAKEDVAVPGGVTGGAAASDTRTALCSCPHPVEAEAQGHGPPGWQGLRHPEGSVGTVMADPTRAQVHGGTLVPGSEGTRWTGPLSPRPALQLGSRCVRPTPGARVPTLAPGVLHAEAQGPPRCLPVREWLASREGGNP